MKPFRWRLWREVSEQSARRLRAPVRAAASLYEGVAAMAHDTDIIEPLRDVDWAARILGVSRGRVYQLVNAGRIPAVRVGERVYFDEDQIRGWIEGGGSPFDQD
jgi:excisionase family DNA binding protein